MRIFLSYASEQETIADRLAAALREAGHNVFRDKESLPAGRAYDDRIRDAVRRCHVFIFLISPQSVAPGRYTLTELKFARERWPKAQGRIVPVLAVTTPPADLPPALSRITFLTPSGNLPAEVLAQIQRRHNAGMWARGLLVTAAVALVAGGLGFGGWWMVQQMNQTARQTVVQAQADSCTVVNELVTLKSAGQLSEAALRQDSMCREFAALKTGEPRERQAADMMAKGDVDNALGLLEDVAKTEPETPAKWERLATLASFRSPETTIRAREAILRLAPKDMANRLQLAAVYFDSSRPEDAISTLRAVLAENPDPFTREVAQINLCSAAAIRGTPEPDLDCSSVNPRKLIDAYGATNLDKTVAAELGFTAVTTELTAMAWQQLQSADGVGGSNALMAQANAASETAVFLNEQLLKTTTNPKLADLRRLQIELLRLPTSFVGKTPDQQLASLDPLAQRAAALAQTFDSPLVQLVQAAVAISQATAPMPTVAMKRRMGTDQPGDVDAIISHLREATGYLRQVQQKNPKSGVYINALLLVSGVSQSAEQLGLPEVQAEAAAEAVEWARFYVEAESTMDSESTLLMTQFEAWRLAKGDARSAAAGAVRQQIGVVRGMTSDPQILNGISNIEAQLSEGASAPFDAPPAVSADTAAPQ